MGKVMYVGMCNRSDGHCSATCDKPVASQQEAQVMLRDHVNKCTFKNQFLCQMAIKGEDHGEEKSRPSGAGSVRDEQGKVPNSDKQPHEEVVDDKSRQEEGTTTV